MSDTTSEKKPRVQSAARAVELLKAVARAESCGIAAGAISTQLGMPRQVVYHLAHTLVEMNMLRKVGRGSYILGPGIGTIAQGFRRQVGSSDMALEFATKAAALSGETAYVVGWLEDEIVVLGTARGIGAIQAAEVPQGTAGDAHARASGKLLLAMANEQDKRRYLDSHSLTRRTKNTITNRDALEVELSKVQENRFSCEREEYALGLSCMAVPLGKVPSMLVLGISAPTFRFDENWERYLGILRGIADEAS